MLFVQGLKAVHVGSEDNWSLTKPWGPFFSQSTSDKEGQHVHEILHWDSTSYLKSQCISQEKQTLELA